MELRHLQYFLKVAEELHFGKAAKLLGISQPPLSHQIQMLEYELGVKLFERTKREVLLTKTGKLLFPKIYSLLQESENIHHLATLAKEGKEGLISIGCISTAFYEILPSVLRPYREVYPNVAISLEENDTAGIISRILKGDLDIGILLLNKIEPPLYFHKLCGNKFVVALSKNHPLSSQEIVKMVDFSGESFVICNRAISPQFYDAIIAVCVNAGFSPKLTYEANSIQNQVGFVACKLAVAVVPQFVQNFSLPNVVYRPIQDLPSAAIDLSIVWNPQCASELTATFIELVKANPISPIVQVGVE